MYQRLKNMLSTAAAQQAESSLLHRDEASILTPVRSKARGHRAAQGAPEEGMASSPARISAYDWVSQKDDPFLGHFLCLGSVGLCHDSSRPRPSHLLPKLYHLSRIPG
jgi:hypothetical protein